MLLRKKPFITLVTTLAGFLFCFASPKTSSPEKPISIHGQAAAPAEDFAELFSDLHLDQAGLSENVFSSAIYGFEKLEQEGTLKRTDVLTIIDFSQPSNQKRLYVVDLLNKQLLFNTLVAHGRNSGTVWANSFSNDPFSMKSSPGFYVTGETYMGDNGYSLRLDGMEKDINDNARDRSIVLHGASYVKESLVNSLGFIGRSWGCPAVPLASHRAIINTIKDGSCLFIYSPDSDYLTKSSLLNS